jgi:transposase
VVFCYEAGRDGFYPYRRLTEAGHEVWVIDSASIEVSRRQKQAKSDGIDGDKLAELMQRKARGEKKALRLVRVPTLEVEDERLLPREREIILHDIGRLRNQIESILFTQGYRGVPKTAAALKSWVAERGELTPQLRERLGREIERLALLEAQLQKVERAMALKAGQGQAAGIAVVAGALMRLCGIGLIGAWVLSSEIFGWRQFRNRREVGAALGLTPTPYSSGEDVRERGISKAGKGDAGGTGLAVAALPARLGAVAVVHDALRRRRQADAADRHRRPGKAAGGRPVALCRPRGRVCGGHVEEGGGGLNRPGSPSANTRRCGTAPSAGQDRPSQPKTLRAKINEFDSDRARRKP